MQILLTQEEHAELLQRARKGDKVPKTEDLQALCTLASNSIVLTDGWRAGHVWGCMLTEEDWYCDQCPAKKVCPYEHKRYSQ